MRSAACAGLFALAGCNQVFGIDKTQPFDASIDTPMDDPHVVLDWQIATVLATGAPAELPTYTPIAPAPSVRIAPLRDPAAAPTDPNAPLGAWLDAKYRSADGTISVPRAYLTSPWRLEYTITGGPPHEVQWLPDDKQGHLTVPIVGRQQRAFLPENTGYSVTPTSGTASYDNARVFTTGVWSEGLVPGTTPPLDFDFFNAVPQNGPMALLSRALGDRALLVDYKSAGGCRYAVGSAELPTDLEAGKHIGATPPWDSGTTQLTVVNPGFSPRLNAALGSRQATPNAGGLLVGATASLAVPALLNSEEGTKKLGMILPAPVMVTLQACPANAATLQPNARPTVLDPFPRIVHVQLADVRQLSRNGNTTALISGLETVIGAPVAGMVTISMPAPLATAITLTTPSQALRLDGDADMIDVGAASGVFALTFETESAAGLRADYYDVALKRIGELQPVRVYTVTSPSVRIDASLLKAGEEYVFEIRSIKGHPRAAQGDFSVIEYPYATAVIYSRTFKPS